jgi:hypothetical protein
MRATPWKRHKKPGVKPDEAKSIRMIPRGA